MIFYFPLQLNNVSFFGFVFPLVHSSVFTLSSFSSPIHFLSPFLFSLSSSSRPISYVEAHPLPSIFFFLSSSTLANPSPPSSHSPFYSFPSLPLLSPTHLPYHSPSTIPIRFAQPPTHWSSVLSQGGQRNGTVISDGGIFGFVGFGLLGSWVSDLCFFFFLLVFWFFFAWKWGSSCGIEQVAITLNR